MTRVTAVIFGINSESLHFVFHFTAAAYPAFKSVRENSVSWKGTASAVLQITEVKLKLLKRTAFRPYVTNLESVRL